MRRIVVLLVLTLAVSACDLITGSEPRPFEVLHVVGLEEISPRPEWVSAFPRVKACAAGLDAPTRNLDAPFSDFSWFTAECASRTPGGICHNFYDDGAILIDRPTLTVGEPRSFYPAKLDALWTAVHEMGHHFEAGEYPTNSHPIHSACRADSILVDTYSPYFQ